MPIILSLAGWLPSHACLAQLQCKLTHVPNYHFPTFSRTAAQNDVFYMHRLQMWLRCERQDGHKGDKADQLAEMIMTLIFVVHKRACRHNWQF